MYKEVILFLTGKLAEKQLAKILENTKKLKSFELTTVVSNVNDLKKALKKI